MEARDWEKLSELLDKLIQMPVNVTWRERKKQLEDKMEEYGSTTALEEVVAWFDE